ncbi:MAG: redoxin domain-containing protein [Bacteroidetes bacterium]|nr:redoxin domain-containing protein [Bacteroidota bacterium]
MKKTSTIVTMKRLFFAFLLLVPTLRSEAQTAAVDYRRDTFIVYVFLLEDCVICQNYSATLHQLHEKYASERIRFIGLFPNRFSSKDKIAAYQKKYDIPFELKMDYFQTRTRKMGVKVTPEVAVYNKSRDEVLYRGRIDDQYVALGRRRSVKTTRELEDALTAIHENRKPTVPVTQAVGCFINFVKN